MKRKLAMILAAVVIWTTALTAPCSAGFYTSAELDPETGVVDLFAAMNACKYIYVAAYRENGQFIGAEYETFRGIEPRTGKVWVGDLMDEAGYWKVFFLDENFCPVWNFIFSRTLSATQKKG